MKARSLAGLVAFLATLVLALTSCQQKDGEGSSPTGIRVDGPLAAPPPNGWADTMSQGTTYADGLHVLHVEGDSPVKVTGVGLRDAEGIELLGAVVVHPGRKSSSGGPVLGWPLPGGDAWAREQLASAPHEDLVGAVLDPGDDTGQGWQVFLGEKVTTSGTGVRRGYEVTYTVGEQQYVTQTEDTAVVCVSTEHVQDGVCDAELAIGDHG